MSNATFHDGGSGVDQLAHPVARDALTGVHQGRGRSKPLGIFFLCLSALVAGCTVGPEHMRPALPASAAIDQGSFLRSGEARAIPAPAAWWRELGDAKLTMLVEQALANAPDVTAARARLEQARAQARLARAATLPLAGTSTAYAHAELPNGAFGTDSSSGGELFLAGFDAQWELDLWGGGRRSLEARRAEAGASEAMLADVRVALGSEVVAAYAALRAAQARRELASDVRRLAALHAELVGQQVRAGTLPRQAAEGAAQVLSRSEAARARAESDIAIALDGLAVLSGQAPGSLGDLGTGPVPLPPAEVAIGDPAAMLARRPDVRAAERRLAAATARIGVAEARRFPAVSLLGLVGIGGSEANDLFDTSRVASLVVPQLNWRFLDFGRSKANLDAARSGRDAALAEYQGSVLRALNDAEGALARFAAARSEWREAGRQGQSANEVARLQESRERAGALSKPQAIVARLDALASQGAAIDRAADLTRQYAALAKALGLGWAETEQP